MADLSSPGVGSGLDIKTIVQELVKADITPTKNRLDRQESSFITQLSALGQVKSALAKLQTTMVKLTDLGQLYSLKTSVSDETVFSATVNDSTTAAAGHYQLEVKQLASRQNLASDVFANASTSVGSGSLTISFGAYSEDNSSFTVNPDRQAVTINIAPGQDSLSAIRDAINNSNSGVQASIIQDSQGARLTFTSPDTGKANAMKISVIDNDNTGLSALAYDPTQANYSLTEKMAAKDSEIIINGLSLSQSSNQFKDSIAGLTIDLKKAQPGSLIDLKVEKNKAQLTTLVNEFIKQFNDSMATLNSLTSYNAETKQGGTLQSDSGIRALKYNLAKLIGEPLASPATIRTLADIGIKTNDQGLLTMNLETFNKAVDENYDGIAAIFAKTATASDPNVHIKTIGTSVKAGNYDLVLNSFTPGSSISGTIGGIYASSSDGVTLAGTGAMKGLSLDISGGAIGARGQISITDGLAAKFTELLDSYLGDKGDLTTRTKQLNGRLEGIGNQREDLQNKAISLASRYTRQFTALDVLLSQMQSTSNFLSQQLANLPQLTYNRR